MQDYFFAYYCFGYFQSNIFFALFHKKFNAKSYMNYFASLNCVLFSSVFLLNFVEAVSIFVQVWTFFCKDIENTKYIWYNLFGNFLQKGKDYETGKSQQNKAC